MELNAMKERKEICDVCHKMWQRGIVAANDGNVSVKLEDGTFLCTPSGVSKAVMTPEILVHTLSLHSNDVQSLPVYLLQLQDNPSVLLTRPPIWFPMFQIQLVQLPDYSK